MERSESIAELAAALALAQGAIVGSEKDAKNPFFKSTYSTLASVWDACRKQLSQNGLSIVQCPEASERGVMVETILCHSSGQYIASKYFMPVTKPDAQAIGSAITYARRYALAAVVGITPAEDDDGNAASGQATPPTYTAAMTEAFPPGISLKGRLMSLAAGVGGAPGTAKIQGDDGLMTFQVFASEPHWQGYVDKNIIYRYEKQGKFRVIAAMKQTDTTPNLGTDPQCTAPPKAATPLQVPHMTQGSIVSVEHGPGKPTTLQLALRDGDLSANTILKPAKLGVATWDKAVGMTIYFSTAPKDGTKIIDLMTYAAYENAQEATQ